MILDLLKSVAGGLLLHACATLAFGPQDADATMLQHDANLAAAPRACLPPPVAEAPAQAGDLSTHSVTGTRS